MAAGDRARAVYANDDAIRHYERALRTLAGLPGLRRPGAGRARAARATCWRSPGSGPRLSRTMRRCGRSSRRRRIAPAPRACIARSAACTGKPAIASAPAPASPPGLERLGEDGSPDRARAALPGDRPARVSGRRQCAAPSRGPSGRSPKRRASEATTPTRSAPARRRQRGRRPTTRWAWRLRAPAALARGGRQDRAEHRARRGARPAAGGLPRLRQPRRALQLARSAPQHRDLPPRARDREEGGRPRLPVAPLRQPRRCLLRADRPLRGGGHRGGANGRRPRPPAGARSITWPCR